MSPAGFEPATTCNHTGITVTLELSLYPLSYGGLVQIPPETPFGLFHCTGRMLPKLHEEVLHSQTRAGHVHNLCARTCYTTSDYH